MSHQLDFILQLSKEEIIDAINRDPTLILAHNQAGDTLLHLSCKQNCVELISELLQLGADPNKSNYRGFTPLMYAVDKKFVQSHFLLRQCEEDLELKEKNAMMIISLLLENGVDPNSITKYKGSAFTFAFMNANIKVCRLLIKYGADIRFQDKVDISYGGRYKIDCYGNDVTPVRHEEEIAIISKVFFYGPHPDMRWERRKNYVMFLVAVGYRPIKGPFVSNKAKIKHDENVRKASRLRIEKALRDKPEIETKDQQIRRFRRERVFCVEGLVRLIASFL